MTWSDFFLFCFLVGFWHTVLSFLGGAVHLHLPFKWHLPFHGGHHGAGGGIAKGGAHLSWFNASSVLAFLAWFGGTGYLLTKHSNLIAIFCLAIAIAAGLTGGWIVFRVMSPLLQGTGAQMNEWGYPHGRSVRRVSIFIPARRNR